MSTSFLHPCDEVVATGRKYHVTCLRKPCLVYLHVRLNDAVVFLLPLTMARCSLHTCTSIKLMAPLTDDEDNSDSHFSDRSMLNRALKAEH